MRIIKGPTVTQIRIFLQDTIPYTDLAIGKNFDQFKQKFFFAKAEIPFPFYEPGAPKVIKFSGGSVNIDNESFLIKSLNFDERKIVLIIEASSDRADRVFDAIGEELKGIDRYKNFSPSNYLIKTEETECAVHLDIDYCRFFSRKFLSFVKKSITKYPQQPLSKVRKVTLKSLSFEISFKQDEILEDMRISIVPKPFVIEPRVATREEDKIFYTRSPYDSETHLRLLRELESFFTKAGI